MKTEGPEKQVDEPFTEYGRYSYADYLTWQIEDMVELIKGKVFKITAAPKRRHQLLAVKIIFLFPQNLLPALIFHIFGGIFHFLFKGIFESFQVFPNLGIKSAYYGCCENSGISGTV